MKKLQNNFTTPEQSKRLLELGVPADSADCYYTDMRTTIWVITEVDRIDWGVKVGGVLFYIPCWSYGRLIKIYDLCAHGFYKLPKVPQNLIKHIISRYDWEIRHVGMDFSKLEE